MTAISRLPRAYPRKAEITRAVDAARTAGIAIGGVEVSPDGTIRILPASSTPVDSAYDRWQASRKGER